MIFWQEFSSADETGERYAEIPITAGTTLHVVVKLYHPYTYFRRNVLLDSSGRVTFSAHRELLIIVPCKYSYLLTY